MTLTDLEDYIQSWCHKGFATDNVVVHIEGQNLGVVQDLKIERDKENKITRLIFVGEK